MKKTVKSLSELKRIALSSGASIDVGGSKFNTSRSKGAYAKAEKPEPIQEQVQEPAPEVANESVTVQVDMAPVAQAMSENADRLSVMFAQAIQKIPNAPAQLKVARLKVVRDVRGYLDYVDVIYK